MLADENQVQVYEMPMLRRNKGLYLDGVIWVNKFLPSQIEKACILSEELGHHFKTVGNILDQRSIANRKQEKLARVWSYEWVIPLSKIIQAYTHGVRSSWELAEYIGVTGEFLNEAIVHYQSKYGLMKRVENYIIYFDPLGVAEFFE